MATFEKKRSSDGRVKIKARIRRQGHELTKCFTRKKDAEAWARKNEADIVAGTFQMYPKRHSLAEAIERYEREVLIHKAPGTKRLQEGQLRWFKGRYGVVQLSQIDACKLSEWRETLRLEKVQRSEFKAPRQRSSSTVNRYFIPLSNLFHLAEREWGWLNRVPRLKALREPLGKTRFLSADEAEKLLSVLNSMGDAPLELIAKISLFTGSRLRETCALQWKHLDFGRGAVIFTVTKSGRSRTMPLPAPLMAELQAWQKVSTASEYVFPDDGGQLPYAYGRIKQKFTRLVKRLGLNDVTFHTLRHTFASWATQAGVSRRAVGDALGHRSLVTTDRYSHVAGEHLREASDLTFSKLTGKYKAVKLPCSGGDGNVRRKVRKRLRTPTAAPTVTPKPEESSTEGMPLNCILR